jgi:hypothetical protein
VRTGGGAYFCELIRHGYVNVLLANALAMRRGAGSTARRSASTWKAGASRAATATMRAINAIFRAGACGGGQHGVLTSGDVRVHPPV